MLQVAGRVLANTSCACMLQSDHIWYCELCKDGGDLLLCDTCPKSFHKECLKLEIVPDGEWSCPICVSLYYSLVSFRSPIYAQFPQCQLNDCIGEKFGKNISKMNIYVSYGAVNPNLVSLF